MMGDKSRMRFEPKAESIILLDSQSQVQLLV